MLEIDSIDVAYGDHLVLNSVSLNVGRGDFIAVVGPNGATL